MNNFPFDVESKEQPQLPPNVVEANGQEGKKFSFHNPFDYHSYPITNPPIFDSTTMLPYSTDGVPRRRRISISNGQIGQIVNHEAYFENEDLDSSLDQDLQYKINEMEFSRPQTTFVVDNFQPPVIAPPPIPINGLQGPPILSQQPPLPPPPLAQPIHSVSEVAGVPPPNHQLIYNNEVIYNAENGPIPGTAAWKKERLLERNRVAASKCRQRKKQAQMQLQDTVNKLEDEIKMKDAKMNELERMISHYQSSIKLALKSGDFKTLQGLI